MGGSSLSIKLRITKETYDKIQECKAKGMSKRGTSKLLGLNKDAALNWWDRPYPLEAIKQPEDPETATREHRLKRENAELRRQLDAALDRHVNDAAFRHFVDTTSTTPFSIPEWTRPARAKSKDSAIVTAFLSDLHFDEVVRPEQIGFVNEYNRSIAIKRLQNFFANTIRLASDHMAGLKYEGIILPLGGDIFSGSIHEELRNTNEATLIESLLYWPGPLIAGIKLLADEFGRVLIPGVVGNHGRLSHKPIAKNRPQDNFDYLLYHLLARELHGDSRIVFNISEGADLSYAVYGTRMLLTHGDQFRGGSGIAGLLSPLLLGDHRKRKRQVAINNAYDWMIMGHWHTLTLGVRGIIVNGSLKGYDEFGQIMNFDYEPAQQAFWVTQPKTMANVAGITGRWPIHVVDKSEKYGVAA